MPRRIGRRRAALPRSVRARAVAAPLLAAASLAALAGVPAAAAAAPPEPGVAAAARTQSDEVMRTYHRLLLRHTRWVETQWDARLGRYRLADFNFAVVLGNAVLLTRGGYDPALAGVEEATLREHTLATLRHYAASNRVAGGTEWGRTLFWDTTNQSYFQLAGRLLWDELDAETRANLDRIARGQAAYTTSLGTGRDPASGGWTTNGLLGGYRGDTKLEEMGVYAQAIAPGLAWAADDPDAGAWREAFGMWGRNEAGMPAADLANPALVDGVPVSANTAHNVWDTFVAENHDSFGPHYQEELWRTQGRNAIHFLLAGQPLPEVIARTPNGEELWRTIMRVMSDAGEPLMPMVDDREHLYGRDVIPLAFLAQVLGDRDAARAEANLAARMEAYQAYPPADRLTKFSGEPKYEPEARAEIAISYLLHEWRNATRGPVRPVSERELFAHAAGAEDLGEGPGLLAHQTQDAWAGTVSKRGFAKLAWQPGHDDWLFDLGGRSPMLLPTTGATVTRRYAAAASRVRDGFEGTASLLTLGGGGASGFAGMTTLPTGTVVYATSGTADGEGTLTVHNRTMPGMPGLDGDRTYASAEGTATVAAADATTPPPTGGRDDTLAFPRTSARWVRMLGVSGNPTYGYSLFELEARDGEGGANVALGAAATASSFDPARPPATVTDGSLSTRWAVSRPDRPRGDSWIAVDLGAPRSLDRVTLRWEAAAGREYRVQVSDDGTTWTDVAAYPRVDVRTHGGWLAVDGRAGLVVRGSSNPLTVKGDRITLSDGPAAGAAGMVVEGYAGADAAATRARAARPAVAVDGDPALRASDADGFLSLFNLSAAPAAGTVALAQDADRVRLYRGVQRVTRAGTAYEAALPAAESRLEPARFTLAASGRRGLPEGLRAEVLDGRRVRLTAPARGGIVVARLDPVGEGLALPVVLLPGRTETVTVPGARPYPLAERDLAVGRPTFPTAPLPAGMSDPDAAVDDDPRTAWTPGPAARMVVDLGAPRALAGVRLDWTLLGRIRDARVSVSDDGRAYRDLGVAAAPGRRWADRTTELDASATARYVAVELPGWTHRDARPTALAVLPG